MNSNNLSIRILLSMAFLIVVIIVALLTVPSKEINMINYPNIVSESRIIIFTNTTQQQNSNQGIVTPIVNLFNNQLFTSGGNRHFNRREDYSNSQTMWEELLNSGYFNSTNSTNDPDENTTVIDIPDDDIEDDDDTEIPDDEEDYDPEFIPCTPTGSLLTTPENFKVAFIGDSGHWDNFRQVLELIRDENVDLVLHQGDLGYDEGDEESPQLWLENVEEVLDPTYAGGTFPYFFSMGNHDAHHWEMNGGYKEILQDRLDTFDINYYGDADELGGKTSFQYNNLFVAMVAPGIDEDFAGSNHALFLHRQLESNPYLWTICSWHKNMHDMQAGGKPDETGWGVYEECRAGGGIIATAHEHSYSRTHVLSDMSEQTIADTTDPLIIMPGQTFAFVSGLGGSSIREQQNDGEHFASIYTSDQGANYGALFIEFYVDGNPRKARGYFKDIEGEVIDEFEIYNDKQEGIECEDENETVPSEGFVYANGTKLYLDGEEFRFVGMNVYGLANDDNIYSCGPAADHGEHPEEYLDAMFSYFSEHGINAVRFWAFQRFTDNGEDFSSIDRVIEYARRYNVKLIPALENQWDDCTYGDYKFNTWYGGDYLEPYGEYELSYKDYVERIVTRYRNESTILMWQLMNEAESENTDGDNDPDSLYDFTLDMSEFVKSLDNNHLVNLGTMGGGQPGTEDDNFILLHSIDSVDIIEYHDYSDEDESLPDNLAEDLDIARDLNKPLFVGEAGINADSDCAECLEDRAELFDAKISALFDNGGVGYLIWQWENGEDSYGRGCGGGYCVTEGDPLIEVMEEYSNST